jgi:hypothetical protein
MDVQSYRFVNIVRTGHLFKNFYTCGKRNVRTPEKKKPSKQPE